MATKQLKQKANYTYTTLKNCEVGGEPVNFYAVVLDATFPHESYNKSGKYVCTLKVTDASLPFTKGEADYISLVFFANKFDQLPVCQRVGDIVRVHRATVGTYKDSKQVSVNICFNSSWALFTGQIPEQPKGSKNNTADQEQFFPVSFSAKQVNIQNNERKIITDMRKWISTSFAKHNVLKTTFITLLDKVREKGFADDGKTAKDIDLQVKVL